jgi:AcrR family transcriptional regulator
MPKAVEMLSTKDRIFLMAERLFAEKGLDGTSMRDITEAAGVNLAAVNYHFGSKDGLIAAMFHRYITPINESRLAMLDAAEAAAGNRPPGLETVLDAFIRPAVLRATEPNKDTDSFMCLMGRCLSEPPAYSQKYIYPLFEKIIERFNAAVGRALPDLPHDEIFMLVAFVGGTLHYALHMWSRPVYKPFDQLKPWDPEELIRQLIAFGAGGLRSRAEAREHGILPDAGQAFGPQADPHDSRIGH